MRSQQWGGEPHEDSDYILNELRTIVRDLFSDRALASHLMNRTLASE